jgi:hypothetical protein
LPAKETFVVSSQLDQALNEAWVTLCMEASRGRRGPFSAQELQEAFRANLPGPRDPPAVAELARALEALSGLGIIEPAE